MSQERSSDPQGERGAFAIGADQALVLAIVLAGMLLRVALMRAAGGDLIDDSYITLRYGRNLFLGQGLVFNPGEHALGAPPLYAVLAGLLWKMATTFLGGGHAVGYLVTCVNIALMGATGILLSRLLPLAPASAAPPVAGAGAPAVPAPAASRSKPACFALVPLVLFAFYLPFVDNTTTGMETTLFVLLQAASLHAVLARRPALAATLLGLTMLVRAEGVLWTGAVLFTETLQHRRPSVRALAPLLAIVVGWTLFATAYYGSPIPLNVVSKSGWVVTGDNAGAPTVLGQLWDVLASFTLLPLGLARLGSAGAWLAVAALVALPLLLALFAVGLVALGKRRDGLFAWGVFFVACVAFYVVGRGATWPSWYAIPPGLAFFIVVSYGAGVLASRGRGSRSMRLRAGGWAALGLLSGVLGVSSAIAWNRLRAPYYRDMEQTYGATGRYIQDHSSAGDSLLVWEVGYIGYLADRYTQEVAGIVSPRVLEALREGHDMADTPMLVRRFRPAFLVLPPEDEAVRDRRFGPWFAETYERVLETRGYWTYKRRE